MTEPAHRLASLAAVSSATLEPRHPVPVRHRRLGRRRQVHARRPPAARLEGDPRRPARAGRAHLRRARLRARRLRLRAAHRRPARRARAGHHDRRRLPLLLDRRAVVHPRRLPRPRAVHAQHGHRRDDRRCRRRARSTAARACSSRPAATSPSSPCCACRTSSSRSTRSTCSASRRMRSRRSRAQVRAVTAELGIEDVHVLPVSALEGDNIVERSERTPWYDGPALLELLESLPAQDELEQALEPFRLPVQLVLRPQGGLAPELAADAAEAERLRDYRAVAGRVVVGLGARRRPRRGLPDRHRDDGHRHPGRGRRRRRGRRAAVGRRCSSPTTSTPRAARSSSPPARFRAARRDDRRGAVPARRADAHRRLARARQARHRDRAGDRRRRSSRATTSTRSSTSPPRRCETNDIGRARLRLAADLPLEPYSANRHGGSFLVIHPSDGATLAAGIVRD